MQVQAVLTLGDHNTFVGQRYAGIGGIGDIGEKHSLPNRRALGGVYVLHIEHNLREAFVEHAGLHFERSLRAFELVLEASQGSHRPWGQVQSVDQRQQPCGEDENRQHAAEVPHAHAAGAHGGDFAVGGEPAQADQNPDQHAHGNGVRERDWNGVKENLGDAG